MATPPGSFSLVDLIESLPDQGATWGPSVTSDTTLNGVPYAPYSKGDKLGRMADWTADSKDGRDGRGGRQQYNRNFRGRLLFYPTFVLSMTHLEVWMEVMMMMFANLTRL